MNVNVREASLTRRSALAAAGLISGSMLIPDTLYASDAPLPSASNNSRRLAVVKGHANLARSELEAVIFEQAKKEGDKLIQSLNESIGNSKAARGRPYYENVYGPVTYANSGYQFVGGQPANGYSFSNGGSIYVELTGGPSVGVSFSFPLSFGGAVGVSMSFARAVSSPGIIVNIPAGGRKKVKANIEYASTPYTTYYIDAYGNRSVYAHLHSYPEVTGRDFKVVNA